MFDVRHEARGGAGGATARRKEPVVVCVGNGGAEGGHESHEFRVGPDDRQGAGGGAEERAAEWRQCDSVSEGGTEFDGSVRVQGEWEGGWNCLNLREITSKLCLL